MNFFIARTKQNLDVHIKAVHVMFQDNACPRFDYNSPPPPTYLLLAKRCTFQVLRARFKNDICPHCKYATTRRSVLYTHIERVEALRAKV